MIAFVLLVGHAAHGSTRWINLGFFTFQPSEFGKLVFVLALAGMLSERQRLIGSWDTTVRVVGIGLIPVLLVFIQPDLGTALVYLAALARDALRRRDSVAAPDGARGHRRAHRGRRPLGRPGSGHQRAQAYQQQRLTCFIHPKTCPVDARYNLEQSLAAIGSGQIRGRGPNGASQVKLGFLPESGTDFVSPVSPSSEDSSELRSCSRSTFSCSGEVCG